MTAHWAEETTAASQGLMPDSHGRAPNNGRPVLPVSRRRLLATDGTRAMFSDTAEPWLVIDPKPFSGIAPTTRRNTHELQGRMLIAPTSTIRRFADLLEVDTDDPAMDARAPGNRADDMSPTRRRAGEGAVVRIAARRTGQRCGPFRGPDADDRLR